MLKHRNLEELYRKTERTIVTAHRGFSGRYPENTLTAMREAIRAGADIIEFDLRPTADGIPVLLHDPTLDRTSNAHGCPEDYTLKELKKFNFSYFRGGHETGKRMEEPEYPEMPIPTFEEVLSELKNEVFMNIQLTRPSDPFLKTICDLFKQYDMYETAYFVTDNYDDSLRVRAIDPEIETCPRNRRIKMDTAELERQKKFGTRIIQPVAADITPEFCRKAEELGLHANMFCSNTDEDNRRFISWGLRGIMTDYTDILLGSINAMKAGK